MNDNIKIPHCNKCVENNKGICKIDNTKINLVVWCPYYKEA